VSRSLVDQLPGTKARPDAAAANDDGLNGAAHAVDACARPVAVCRLAGMEDTPMLKFLLWLLLLVVCWPLALMSVLLWPLVWLILLPFRLLGIVVEGVFAFLRAMLMLPARVLGGGQGRA
jgi:hypothetical protein